MEDKSIWPGKMYCRRWIAENKWKESDNHQPTHHYTNDDF
jgi:hypothetical protein